MYVFKKFWFRGIVGGALFMVNVLLYKLSLCTRSVGALFVTVPSSITPLLAGMGHRSYISFLTDGVGTRIGGHFNGMSRLGELASSCLFLRAAKDDSVRVGLLPLGSSMGIVYMIGAIYNPTYSDRIHFCGAS